jgi:cell wall-associated NlpC family hydrolase
MNKKNVFGYLICFALIVGAVACKFSKNQQSSKSKVSKSQPKSKSKSDSKSNTNISDLRKELVKTARSYIGTSYRYGGTNRAGLDCSGLMLITFKSQGIELPRNSAAQAGIGDDVEVQHLLPGDLLFFSEKKGNKKVSHVGMVTENIDKENVKFIHATTKLGVVENNLHSNVYWPIFIKARRVCK